jgi:hypothetical protein
LFLNVENPDIAANRLNTDLLSIDEWSKEWLITFNALKTESMTIAHKMNPIDHPPLKFQGHTLVDFLLINTLV